MILILYSKISKNDSIFAALTTTIYKRHGRETYKQIIILTILLLSRLLYITEGKYWNQLKKFRKFRDVLSSGSHETGSTAKKVTASDSVKKYVCGCVCVCVCMCVCDAFLLASISPYISKVHGHFWLKFGMELSIYGTLMLLNFCGDWGKGLGARAKLLWVSKKTFGNQSFRYLSNIKVGQKNFSQKPPPSPKNSKK